MASENISSNMETVQNSKQLEDAIQTAVQSAIDNLFESGVLGRGHKRGPWSRDDRQLCKPGEENDSKDGSIEKRSECRFHRGRKMKGNFHHRPHHFHHHHGPRGWAGGFHKGRGDKHGKFGKFGKHGFKLAFLECASRLEKLAPAIENTDTIIETVKEIGQDNNNQVALVDNVRKDLQRLQFNDNVTVIENDWLLFSKA